MDILVILARRRGFSDKPVVGTTMARWREKATRAALLLLVVALAVLTLAAPVPAQAPPETIVGRPRVVNGDTLAFRDAAGAPTVYVRLAWIDAPERDTEAGLIAAGALEAVLGMTSRHVHCLITGVDRDRRLVGVCTPLTEKASLSLQQHLVDLGFARLEPGFPRGGQLATVEALARRAGAGFWACDAPTPESWHDAKAAFCH